MRTRGAGGTISTPGTCPPTAIWPDEFSLGDQVNIMRALFADTLSLEDMPGALLGLADTVGIDDALSATAFAQWLDTFGVADQAGIKLDLLDALGLTDDISIMPDLFDTFRVVDDIGAVKIGGVIENVRMHDELIITVDDAVVLGDAWTDEANTGTNHGSDTTLSVKANLAVGAQGADAYIKFNLRNQLSTDPLFGFSSLPDSFLTLTFITQSNSAVIEETITINALIQTTDPWGESTITWANAPAHSATIEGAVGVPAGVVRTVHNVIMTTEMDNMIGNWVSFRLRNTSPVSTATIIVSSKEATAADRPTVNFQAFT